MYGISRRGLLQSGVAAGVLAATGLPLRAQTRGGKTTAFFCSQLTLPSTYSV